jgi:hypothetical protein
MGTWPPKHVPRQNVARARLDEVDMVAVCERDTNNAGGPLILSSRTERVIKNGEVPIIHNVSPARCPLIHFEPRFAA